MKEITVKVLSSVGDFFFSLWERTCKMSKTDTWYQQFCVWIVLIISSFVFLFGSCWFTIYCLKETGVIKQTTTHRPRPHNIKSIKSSEANNVGQSEN